MGCHCSKDKGPDVELPAIPMIKVALVGPPGSGKTALAKRFVTNSFPQEYKADTLVDVGVKIIDSADDFGMATIEVWTHPGEGDVPLPAEQCTAHAWMIVVSATSSFLSESLQRQYDSKVAPYLRDARRPGLPVPLCAVVTHMDQLGAQPDVYIALQETVLGWADDHGAAAAFVSCKTGDGVHKAFKALAARAHACLQQPRPESNRVEAVGGRGTGDSVRQLSAHQGEIDEKT